MTKDTSKLILIKFTKNNIIKSAKLKIYAVNMPSI